MKIQLSTTLFAAVAMGASSDVVAARSGKDGSALRRGNAAAADAPAALRRLKKTIAAGAGAPDAEADQAPPLAAAKSNADAVADALEVIAAWISRKDAPVDAPLLKKSLRSLDEAARREDVIPKMKKKNAPKGPGAPGVGASDLVAAAGELVDAILKLGRDGALSREAVEAKLRAIADQLAAAPSPSDDAAPAEFQGAMAATLKDVIEDTLVQVIKAPRPVDADFLKTMARRLGGDRLVLQAAASPGKITDTGILGTKKSVVDSPVDAMPGDRQLQATDFVDCVGGYVSTNSTQTCKEACGVDCCIGGTPPSSTTFAEACGGFTGRVYKDGSCEGYQACASANITIVKDGSCQGYQACWYANIPIVKEGSCVDYRACILTAYGADGYVASISNSCQGVKACYILAQYGTVGVVDGSCQDFQACIGMARYGTVGDVRGSCQDYRACYRMAYRGTVGDVGGSCNVPGTCSGMAFDAGDDISGLADCCNGARIGALGECDGAATDADLPPECSPQPSSQPSTSRQPSTSTQPSTQPSKICDAALKEFEELEAQLEDAEAQIQVLGCSPTIDCGSITKVKDCRSEAQCTWDKSNRICKSM